MAASSWVPRKDGLAAIRAPSQNFSDWCAADNKQVQDSISRFGYLEQEASSFARWLDGRECQRRNQNSRDRKKDWFPTALRVQDVRVLSDNHYKMKTTPFEWRSANGEGRPPQTPET